MEHASRLDLASFEDPVFYDKLDRARRQTTGRMGLLAALLNIGQDTVTLVVAFHRADRIFALADGCCWRPP